MRLKTVLPPAWLVRVALLASVVAVLAIAPAAGDEPPAVRVETWLLLGPVSDPLPLFHDEQAGGYDLAARLEATVAPHWPWTPQTGARETRLATTRREWKTVRARKKGRVVLAAPQGSGKRDSATAWLAVYLETERYVAPTLELLGQHPRRAWLDGAPVAAGGAGAEPGEVRGKLELIAGRHLLLVETLLDPARDEEWSIGAALEGDGERAPAVVASLEPGRGVTIHDILDPPMVQSAAVSPTGERVAAALRRYHPGTDQSEGWIEIWGETLRRTWRGGFDISQVAWSPAAEATLSYVTTQPGKNGGKPLSTLWLADLRANTVRPLLERVESFHSYRWSPDGKAIAFLTTTERKPDERGIKRLEGVMDRWAKYRDKRYLSLVTVPGGARRRLTAGPVSTESPRFSPDGSKLLFTREVEDFEERPFSRTELWELELATSEARLLRDGRWINEASYAPDGKRLLIRAGAEEFDERGRDLPEGVIPSAYDGQLFVWDPAADEVEAITREFDPAVTSAEWSRADGNIYLTAQERDYVRLYRYDVAASRFEPLETRHDVFGGLDLAERAAVAVGTASSPWTPQSLVRLDLAANRTTTLRSPREWFARVETGTVEPWSFTTESGKEIDGRVYLPPGFDPSRKYPGIVYYYGGAGPVSRDFGGRYPKEYWASHGYVVYVLQPSGATGFGQAFSAEHVNNWGKTTADEIIQGTREFLDAHPFVDRERVGCIGASYGGFMTMLLSTKSDLYAAAVAHAGISSLASYWGEGYWGYSYSSIATAGSYPWNRSDLYVEQSPLFRADRTRVPILLTHGVDDTNVPVGESDQFYIALKLLGKDVEYLQVDGQDHWILEHDKRVLWSRSIVAWFDKWLKDQPEWWSALYP